MKALEQLAINHNLDEKRINKLRYFANTLNKGLHPDQNLTGWQSVYTEMLGAEKVGQHIMDVAKETDMHDFITMMYKGGFRFVVSLNVTIKTNDGHTHKWPDCLHTCFKN